MAYGTYIVHVAPEDLDRLAKSIEATIDTSAGAPLVSVSPTRALLGPVYAAALARTDPDRTLEEILRRLGAQWLESVTPGRLAQLIAFREPSELAGDRATRDRTLVDGGYDWHLRASRLVEAWDLFGGPVDIDWGDLVVGQIDTGYTQHPCLGWLNGLSAWVDTSRDRNFFFRELASDPDSDRWANRDPLSAEDPVMGAHGGHGTRTGSVLSGFDVSAEGRATGRDRPAILGYFGAAPRVPYVPIRISDSVWINDTTDGLASALEHLVNDVGSHVITVSMGAALPAFLPPKAQDMIDRAYANGVIICCAAGNLIDSVVTPARAPRTIAVGGSAPGDRPWSGSSFGRHVDISAPAWPIWRASTTQRGRFEYGYGDGTSFATPQVAGTAALWLRRHGAALDATYPERWMRVAAFLAVLRQTARTPPGWETSKYGRGLLDARAVLDAPLPDPLTLQRDTEPHS
jgi:subtilisin family serine protease